ncbi:hypothetical protein [Deinococcus geothermalis]|uniref:hypothetical protein n=1 Tax=Deinococcus geothermalis TaxID=68909 RepID=UPI002357E5C9|nr:hypothetical protein [Deinococcus geothermalis]
MRPRYFRFPGGCATEAAVQLAEVQGLPVFHWDVVGGDVNQPAPKRITRQVLERVRLGDTDHSLCFWRKTC